MSKSIEEIKEILKRIDNYIVSHIPYMDSFNEPGQALVKILNEDLFGEKFTKLLINNQEIKNDIQELINSKLIDESLKSLLGASLVNSTFIPPIALDTNNPVQAIANLQINPPGGVLQTSNDNLNIEEKNDQSDLICEVPNNSNPPQINIEELESVKFTGETQNQEESC